MPTYTYQCDDCGHSFDAFQKFSDEPLSVCPTCEGHIRRVIHPTPIVFKGSGWYINDSKGKSSTTSTPAGKDADGKADAKPETKPEPAAEKKSEPVAAAATSD